jgi:hypothetical protein
MSNAIPRYVAIHEAGHAVAAWALSKDAGWSFRGAGFDRIVIRTRFEAAIAPYIDDRGREVDCVGIVEGATFYNPSLSFVPDMKVYDADSDSLVDDNSFFVERERRRMEAEVICLFAGPLAEARYRRISPWRAFLFGGETDNERARLVLRDFYRSDDLLGQAYATLYRRASALVGKHWSAIDRVASALMIQRSLSGDEALPIIEAAGVIRTNSKRRPRGTKASTGAGTAQISGR